MQTIEVITRIVPAFDKKGGATIDLSEKANAKWATYRTRSGRPISHKSGMYNLTTEQTIKWTDMATVVDKERILRTTMMCWESMRMKRESSRTVATNSLSSSMLEQVLGEDSLILKSFES